MCYACACDADKAFYTSDPPENRSHISNWSQSSSTLSFHGHHQCISFMAHQGLRAIVAFCAIQCFTANIKLLHWRRSGRPMTIGQSMPILYYVARVCSIFQCFPVLCNVYHYCAMSHSALASPCHFNFFVMFCSFFSQCFAMFICIMQCLSL